MQQVLPVRGGAGLLVLGGEPAVLGEQRLEPAGDRAWIVDQLLGVADEGGEGGGGQVLMTRRRSGAFRTPAPPRPP